MNKLQTVRPSSCPHPTVSVRGPAYPTLRANPFPKVTDILPTSLIYIILSTRGYTPWRPAAVMSTTRCKMDHSLRFSRAIENAPDTPGTDVLYQPSDPFSS